MALYSLSFDLFALAVRSNRRCGRRRSRCPKCARTRPVARGAFPPPWNFTTRWKIGERRYHERKTRPFEWCDELGSVCACLTPQLPVRSRARVRYSGLLERAEHHVHAHVVEEVRTRVVERIGRVARPRAQNRVQPTFKETRSKETRNRAQPTHTSPSLRGIMEKALWTPRQFAQSRGPGLLCANSRSLRRQPHRRDRSYSGSRGQRRPSPST